MLMIFGSAELRMVRCCGLAASVLVGQLGAYTPGVANPTAVDGFVVNTSDKRDVLVFYNCVYNASEGYAAKMAWTGNVATLNAGTTSAAYKEDVRRRVNFYRAMCGLPADITFNSTKSAKCQKAALMMSANNALDHTPPNNWLGYTQDGYDAAAASNLALGNHGPAAIDAYMEETGSGNEPVGHRRWMLYSRAQEMGTGDIPYVFPRNSANSLWIKLDPNPAPAPAPKFVAWPNAGFVPHGLSPARWSLSYPGANFSAATVTMTKAGSSVSNTIISKTQLNVADNTIVWQPSGLPSSVTADVTYNVTVSGISGSGVPTSHSYSVTLFNPDILGESVTINGSSTPATVGQTYTFNPITQADSYELKVSKTSSASWTEGAEDSPVPKITQSISPGYSLRQSSVKRTGSKAFQFTYPVTVFDDQSFVVTRDVIPTATSKLNFYDRAGYVVTGNTLKAQVSTDNGTNWTTVFTRNGSTGNQDSVWNTRSISLSSYAGMVISLRFIMENNVNSGYVGTDPDYGFFIDDITVTNATELVNATNTTLAGAATSFTLNSTTAGGALVAGTAYNMQIRPKLGTRFYSYGAMKTVTAKIATGFQAWLANYPQVTGGVADDHDSDGIPNGVEYALGMNPIAKDAASLPKAAVSGNNFVLSYTQPSGISGVTYGAKWSQNLVDWFPITDTGSGNSHIFSVSMTGKTKLFIRHNVEIAP